MANELKTYLEDPFLSAIMNEIKDAGAIKSSLIDITHKCNLRCEGCYFFEEEMDSHKKMESEEEFDAFIESERQRGTNMFTVVGGEPAYEIERLKKLAKHFKLIVVSNGYFKIPYEGLENIRLSISFWGDEEQDTLLRGRGKQKVFETALKNYRNDPRVGFYYTTIPGFTDKIRPAVERMVENGNFVSFNFYGDLANKGGSYSHKNGHWSVIDIIRELSLEFPNDIYSSRHMNETISRRTLFGVEWGYNVCSSVTYDHPDNLERIQKGKRYPTQFRAYNADLKTTRRCCVGQARDCGTCTDLWSIYGWVVGSLRAHLQSFDDFQNWLFTTYIFYISCGFIDRRAIPQGRMLELYQRMNGEASSLPLKNSMEADPSLSGLYGT